MTLFLGNKNFRICNFSACITLLKIPIKYQYGSDFNFLLSYGNFFVRYTYLFLPNMENNVDTLNVIIKNIREKLNTNRHGTYIESLWWHHRTIHHFTTNFVKLQHFYHRYTTDLRSITWFLQHDLYTNNISRAKKTLYFILMLTMWHMSFKNFVKSVFDAFTSWVASLTLYLQSVSLYVSLTWFRCCYPATVKSGIVDNGTSD